ncbi:unnamed protein product [Protopolystoma xenopodis]|uniref:C2H2-type domain-containing protein n=1 Tax=Protopolystoma xenopodis TaxID=117903 RepID=A0A448X8K5_9PLAT|nr:unnamed protein product [Protopolystoma xenopodis]
MPDLAKSTGLISDEQQKRSQPSDRPTCDALTPLTYPCPHCPRKLRHLKLLNAHILNYHKTVASGSSHGSDSFIDIVTTQTTTTSTTASSPALQPMVITMSITSDRMSATPVSAATPLLRNLSPMPGASCEAKRLSRHTPSSINLRPSGGSESEISMSDIKVKSPLRDQTREGSRTTSAPEAQGKLVRRIS